MDPEHPVDLAKVVEVLKTGVATPTDVPSNAILTEALAAVREKAPGPGAEALSPTGQAVAKDLSDTLKHTELFVEQKNRDELLQRMAQHVAEIARLQASDPGKSLQLKLVQQGVAPPAGAVWRLFRNEQLPAKAGRLTRELVLSPDFRHFLTDVIAAGQQVVAEITTDPEQTPQSQSQSQQGRRSEEKTFSQIVQEPRDGGDAGEPPINEALLGRLLALAQRAQSHPEYREILTILDRGAERAKSEGAGDAAAARTATGSSQEPTTSFTEWEASLAPAERHVLAEVQMNSEALLACIRQLLENLANTSLEEFFQDLWETQQTLANDEQAIEALRAVLDWVGRCTRDTNYIQENPEQVRRDGARLLTDLRQSLVDKYRPAVEHLLGQLRYYLDRMKRDPLTQKLTGDLGSLTSHLFYDQQGNPTLKPELLTDLQVVLPAVLQNLRYLKIPDIEVHEPGLDFLATNLVINVGELAPHHLRLVVTSDIPEREGEAARNLVDFEMSRIHAEARNIRFAIDRSGLPPLSDTGLADIRIFEEGMFIKLSMQPILGRETASGERLKVKAGLQVMQAECRLENFDLSVHGSGHDWMYYLLGPYIRRLVREKIEQSVCNFFMTSDLMATVPLPIPTTAADALYSSQQQPSSGATESSSQTVPEAAPLGAGGLAAAHHPASQPLGLPTSESQPRHSQSQPY